MNEFGTNVDVLGSWNPSPIDLSRAEVNPNWEDVETDTEWDNEQRNPPQPANAEEEEGYRRPIALLLVLLGAKATQMWRS